jgi:hypothetical protein
VADGRRRKAEFRGRPADMPLFQHDLKENQEVKVNAREIDFIQHIAEIISFDSALTNVDMR